MEFPSNKWATFLYKCLRERVRAERFASLAKTLSRETPLPGLKIAAICLEPACKGTFGVDPLLPAYVERLLASQVVNDSDVLRALLGHTADDGRHMENDVATGRRGSSYGQRTPELEELLFYRIAKNLGTGQAPKTVKEARMLIAVTSKWMSAFAARETNSMLFDDPNAELEQRHAKVVLAREGLGILLIAMTESRKMVGVIDAALPKDVRKEFKLSLSTFIPLLAQTSMQVADRLEMFQKMHDLYEEQSQSVGGAANDSLEAQQLQLSSIQDGRATNSRGGLYVYVNALVDCAYIDDNAVLNYLNLRYNGDIQNLTVDLIMASFDVISNAMYRNAPAHRIFALRSFLVNKIPILLLYFSSTMFPPSTPEYCIAQALSHVDPHAFPSFSQTLNMAANNRIIYDVQQDFLLACALHQLIPERSITRLLGEVPLRSVGSKIVKEHLIAQCNANFQKVEELVNDIETLDGDVGVIVGTLTEIILNLVSSKETMSLKTICGLLSRKPLSLDIFLQFTPPSTILYPICQLLDSWRFDEDQGEYQPAYDDFAAILLLVLVLVDRYGFNIYDLGYADGGSFIARLLRYGATSQPVAELSTHQDKHLTLWVGGLFGTENISDELLSSCLPQDFYLIVPTLFDLSIRACMAKVLDRESLEGGLEFLLETFLLPSLVGAFRWLANHIWESTHGDTDLVMQILHKLIRPSSISGDALAMHTTILSITAHRLDHALSRLQRREPTRSDIDPLRDTLRNHLTHKRNRDIPNSELESWTSTPGGGLLAALRKTIQSLVLWSSSIDISRSPPSYTHDQLFMSVQLLGVKRTLAALLDEIVAQTEQGNGDVALDIATNMICAPSGHTYPCNPATPPYGDPTTVPQRRETRLTLRDALRFEKEDAAKLLSTEPAKAEAIVRLSRRVETQLAPVLPAAPLSGLDATMTAAQVQEMMESMPMDLSTAADTGVLAATGDTDLTGGGNAANMDAATRNLDLGMRMGDVGLGLVAPRGSIDFSIRGGGTEFGAQGEDNVQGGEAEEEEEDIFAGLVGLDADMDFS